MTIISETITADRIEEALRGSWPSAALVDAPQPIRGGEWASLCRLRLTGLPAGVPGDLVLRVAPHAEMAAKEQAVQVAAAEAGVSTPRIHLTGPAGQPLPGAWAVMDVAPGAPLVEADGVAALARLPQILRRLPHQLAGTMASIHRVDPVPVVDRVRAAAPSVALTVDELWPHLEAAAEAAGRPDLADAVERLAGIRPPEDSVVLCHGDLHPLNLLADGADVTIVDWTGAIVAPPAFDVAFTALLLRLAPMPTPRPLRPVVTAGAAVLARRFVRSYERANPSADLTHLDWYTALHAARILADHATWTRTGDPRALHHPWRLAVPAAARALGVRWSGRRRSP